MSYIGNTPGVSSQRVVLEEVVSGSPKSTFTPISGYTLGYVDVLVNGVEVDTADFTASDGVNVTLATAAAVGDTVKIKTWLPRGLSDGYLKSEADAKYVAKAGSTMTGDLVLDNGNADGAQLQLASSGYANWSLDNYSGRLRAYYGSTEYFTINASGNVGIGTNSPLSGGILTAQLGMAVKTDGGYFGGQAYFDAGWKNAVSSQGGWAIRSSSGVFTLWTGASSSAAGSVISGFAERLRVTATGSVGIGTDSPTTKLNVVGATNSGIAVNDGTVNTILYNTSSSYGSIGTTTNHALAFFTNNIERMRITPSGELTMTGLATIVGNGVESAAFSASQGTLSSAGYNYILAAPNDAGNKCTMFVNGSARSADGGVNALTFRNDGGPLNLGSTAFVTSVLSSSDYRNKENVLDYVGALDDVMAVPVRKYNYIHTGDTTQYSGFFAHELQAVAPYAVFNAKDEVDDDGNPRYQGVDLSKVVPVLWGAIQEQQAIIEQLRAEIAALKGAQQ